MQRTSSSRASLVVATATAAIVALASAAGAADLAFVPNRGQAAAGIAWLGHAPGGTVAVSATAVSLALPALELPVELRFVDGDAAAAVVGIEPLPGTVSYLRGDDPAAWRTALPSFAGVAVRDLYPGVELQLEGPGATLKGTFVVAPGADPAQLRWRYHGVEEVRLRPDGSLELDAARRQLSEAAPIAWQLDGGVRVPVAVSYRLAADGTLGFALGSYDPARELVIDPYLELASLVGGSDADEGRDVAVDAAGNIYLTGSTRSGDFIAAGAPQATYAGPTDPANLGDAFIAKLAPDGHTVLWMTYLGGSGQDVGDALRLTPGGDIVIAGTTESTDFPTRNPLQAAQGGQDCSSPPCTDLFVARLAASGDALVFSTYLGGSRDEIASLVDFGTRQHTVGLDVDGAGNVYVVGVSDSPDFPVAGGFQSQPAGLSDLVLATLAPGGGQLRYSTYLGGSGAEYSGGVAADDSGRAWVVGGTLSSNLPLRNALQTQRRGPADAVAARFDTTRAGAASLLSATYLGGDSNDQAFDVAVDGTGNAVVTGVTGSTDFPLAGAFQAVNASAAEPQPRDAFLAVLAAGGGQLLYGTYFGGSGFDVAYDLAMDDAGVVAITGPTRSDDLPVRLPYQAARREGLDVFVARFDPGRSGDASLLDATYLGGDESDNAYGIASAGDGSVVVTGFTGGAVSETFPVDTTLGPIATSDGAFVARLAPRVQQWVLVGSRADGANDSLWRTDLGLFNASDSVAEVEVRFHGAGGVLTETLMVAPGRQRILVDVVGRLGGSGSGAIEVLANRDVKLTSRTYNLVATGQTCYPGGTLGQGFGATGSRAALVAGDRAWLPQLAETAAYRTNIALTNTGLAPAHVTVRLFDGEGRQLASYGVDLAPGQWRQENRPFFRLAGRTDVTSGYATVTVDQGGGVVAVGSVVDNVTNDPTSVPMVPGDAGGTTTWVLVASHADGANNSVWRTDLAILNSGSGDATATVRLHLPNGGTLERVVAVPFRDQVLLADVVGSLSYTGSGAVEVISDSPVVVSSRIYNRVAASQPCYGGGTLGQENAGYGPDDGLAAGDSAWLNQLSENAAYRTNIALTNSGDTTATVLVELFDGNGTALVSYRLELAPGQWRQDNRPFSRRAGRSDLAAAAARITVEAGGGILATASVVDNVTNDPTTVVWLE